MDEILHENSNSEGEYKIAKIYDAFNTTNPRLTNVNISMSDLNVDPHPNVLGHEVICTKIMDALVDADNKKDISELTINDIKDQVYTGEGITPKVTIKDGNTQLVENRDFTVSYSDNVNIGEAKVTIIGIGNYEGKVIKTFNITNSEQKDISSLNINQLDDETYTGIKITPDVEITDGDYRLSKNTDYELSYENNINVGTAKVTIRGIGNYTGQVEKQFNIVRKDINYTTILDIPDQIYTGQSIEADVVIESDGIVLNEGEDYIIEYINNQEVGTATIRIEVMGNYTGTMTKTFNIVEADSNSGNQNTGTSNNGDDTVADKIIPFAGENAALIILFVVLFTVAVTTFIWLKKNKDFK